MTTPEQNDDMGVVGGASRAIGGLLLEALTNGAVFLSLIVVIAAVITRNPPFLALGVAVGLVGIVFPWLGVYRKWPDASMTLVVVAVLLADFATLWLLWKRA